MDVRKQLDADYIINLIVSLMVDKNRLPKNTTLKERHTFIKNIIIDSLCGMTYKDISLKYHRSPSRILQIRANFNWKKNSYKKYIDQMLKGIL